MAPEMMMSLASCFLPGFGFFGQQPPFRLSIPVNARMKRLCIFFDSGVAQDFIFPTLSFFDRSGKQIPRAEMIQGVRLSSSREPIAQDDVVSRAIRGKPLRSAVELRPELAMEFRRSVDLSRIEIANCVNPVGRRSRHLSVNGYDKGRLTFFYRNITPERMMAELEAMCGDLGVALSDRGATPHCQHLQELVLSRLNEQNLNWPAQRLAQLLPLFEGEAEMTPFRHRLCSEIVAQVLDRRSHVSTSTFTPLAPLLSTPERLGSVLTEANHMLSKRRGHIVRVQASKHVVAEPKLVVRRDEYLSALQRVFPALEDCGVNPMLCYGSLLGAVREGGFLGHDDDVDLLYFDGSRSREEMMARRGDLIKRLEPSGFHLGGTMDNINFHIRGAECTLDLFPSWEEGEYIHVMMKYPTYQRIPKSVLFPRSTVVLHGHSFSAPAQPDLFLGERYGAGWKIPDPYYEWPWKINAAKAAA